ncbi:hypothetical protein E3P99_02176 [Wallemia hederae]|uniref:Methyltransferase domain-containing protein n=1 Tax=Wallemia hederae TaxID=1540922 RepID=A0A4T0FN51_9BASI|nr:hypothetical protein E3P99_02176 [Wallemia hederae]
MDRQAMRELLKEHNEQGWEAIWRLSDSPPWDNGQVQPLLRHYIEKRGLPLPEPSRDVKVLVPGCGKGYDVLYFASLGYTAVGMDISPEGVRLANAFMEKQGDVKGAEVRCADFFVHEEQYDVVYDYTFFCAIPLHKREEYAARMKRIVKAGGLLITLVFPIKEELVDGVEQGPPFGYTPQVYTKLLGEGFEQVLDEYPPIEVDNRGIKRMNAFKRAA